jgi:MazG family protein
VANPEELEFLVEIMAKLRGPDGCPWDRDQSWESLRGYLLEEAHEALSALDARDFVELPEELGDLLFQIVFLSQIGSEEGRFTIHDVVRGISEKMVRRHPHVFGEAEAADSDAVLRQWEEIKAQEKPKRKGLLEGLPPSLPALATAQRLGEKASRVGFDWSGPEPVLAKIDEELGELKEALALPGEQDSPAVVEELGDLLFSVAMLSRQLGLDGEAVLAKANKKFRRRFGRMEAEAGAESETLGDRSVEAWEAAWQRAKEERR